MKKIILTLTILFTLNNLIFCQTTTQQILKKKISEYLAVRLDGRQLGLTYFSGDLNNDGAIDYAVKYCIQTKSEETKGGGSAMMTYNCIEEGIAVYIKTGNEYVLKADKSSENLGIYSTNDTYYNIKKIENGKIVVESSAYAAEDPRCCPSIIKKVYVKYNNGKLTKQ